nr:MAG TPA: hypothetical protein [Caudoviricetes sp.]
MLITHKKSLKMKLHTIVCKWFVVYNRVERRLHGR